MKSKKIITWVAVVAIILSFLAPLLTFFFDADSSQSTIETTAQSPN
ncbi:MAG: hypothetical protein ACD_3C00026G0007 [uncultured bacterium (gcode 4)]|uniref:Uncharacterized protein n=1 Tax=uncultured bacterium (gcode 4) TaxID=1234023 RepID=K2FCD4_9BACT|nr:MAG: hypothetical protein ACD_3C00026G0007 [uncultured bacterium (gcode 4)]